MAFLDETGVTTLTSDIKTLTDATYPANAAIINAYSSSSSYAVGDYCIYGGLFYKCNTATSSGESWTPGHWTQTNVATELGTKMVLLSYGNNTWADFLAAFNANAIVYCKASSNSNPGTGSQGRMAFMAFVSYSGTTPTSVEFQYYRSVSSHSDSQQGDQVFIYKLENTNGGKWTVITRETATKMVAGTGLSSSYNSNTLTLSVDSNYQIPAGGTSGQVLAKASATDRDLTWESMPTGIPSGGTSGQVIKKASSTDYDIEWGSLVEPATATPLIDGTADVGSSDKYAREDHVHPTDTSLLNLVYPVGSIFTSTNSTSPASLFGGTWERITGKFLLAATDSGASGASQAAGNTGGAATVTLTVDNLPSHNHTYDKSSTSTGGHAITTAQMPKHKHNLAWAGSETELVGLNSGSGAGYNLPWNSGKNSYNLTTTTTGSGNTHSHSITLTSTNSGSKGSGTAVDKMPPYLSVYMWKRTA